MESTHRDESQRHSPRKTTGKANMSPIMGLSTALDIAREVAARFQPQERDEISSTALKNMGTDSYDWRAGVSLLQFSFILGHFVPLQWVQFNSSANDEENMKDALSSIGLFPELAGSLFDTLSLPMGFKRVYDLHNSTMSDSDVDVMVDVGGHVIREGSEPTTYSYGVIETDETPVGYVRVRLIDPNGYLYKIRKPGTSDFYFSSAKLLHDISLRKKAPIHGPACRQTIEKLVDDEIQSIEVDFVVSTSCREWPKEAEHWSARQRPSGWPSEDLIQRVIADACHLVPTSHPKSRNPDVEWRYSFSVAERTLAKSLTDSQRQGYILLKTIVMHELSRPNVLCSYHLKTLLFWQCEKIPASEWTTDTGLAASMLCVLDELLLCVASQYLPHYFIPECNLFDHIHPEFLTDVARILNHIRSEPLRCVLDFNKRYRFGVSGILVKYRMICQAEAGNLAAAFSDVIDDATVRHDNRRKRYERQQRALWTFGKLCLKHATYIIGYNALCAFEQLADVTRCLTGDDFDALALMTCAGLEIGTTDPLEYIAEHSTDCDQNSYVLSNLACLYHSEAFTHVRKQDMLEKAEEMLKKAEEHFLEAMSDTDTSDAMIKVDYSMFLVHLHRYDEATDLLKQIIASECKHPVSSNTYRSNMKNITEDENLLKEMNHQGGIRTASHAFAYYVLAKIYCDTDRKTDAETLLLDFQRLCSDIMSKGTVDVTMRARAFSLLGYAYLAVNNYSQAGQAFDKAVHLVDGYTLAEANRNLCDVLRLYMQMLFTLWSWTVSETETTQSNEVAPRNTLSGKVQYVSPETIADAPAENTATGNLAPESVGTDSTTERAGHGQRQSVAQDSLGIDVHDWTAGVSLLQLSFVLDQFLPQRHIRRSIATATIQRIYATFCSGWPKEADHWPTRQRPSGWPSKQLIQSVIAYGCPVIPTSHPKSRNPDVEWRRSFSVAELTLEQSLTDSQLQCYVLLKTIVMHELNHSNILTTYHLKTVFFWQCEKIPASEWSTDTGLAANLLWLLDQLVYCVATHCLPHYFIPENNLFDHINPDFLTDVARTISSIRRDPLRHVLAFNKHFRFRSVVSCDLASILSDIIDDTTLIYYQQPKRFLKQYHALKELGKQHMREKRYDEATCVFTQRVQIEHRLIDSDATTCSQMNSACLELEAAQALGVFEYLVATFPVYWGTARVCTTRRPSLLAMRTNGRRCCRRRTRTF